MTREIRLASAADVDDIVALSEHFLASTDYGQRMPTSAAAIRAFTQRLIDAGDDAAILVATNEAQQPIAMLAIWCYEHPMSAERVAEELAWWVEPSHRGSLGVRLLRRAEAWARAHGAAVMRMVAPTEQVGRIYHACGYSPVETLFQRRFA